MVFDLSQQSIQKSVFLRDLISELEQINRELDDCFENITPDQYNLKTSKAWSLAECVEHLNIAAKVYIPLIQDKINQPDKVQEEDEWYVRSKTCKTYVDVFINHRKKIKATAPKKITPRQTNFSISDIELLKENNQVLKALMEQSYHLDINRNNLLPPNKYFYVVWVKQGRIRFPYLSVASRVFKFSLGGTYEIVVSHTRRHLEQIKEYRLAFD